MTEEKPQLQPDCENFCKDDAARSDKRAMMNKTWYNSVYFSVKDSLQYIAGILTAAGIATAVKPFADAMNASGASLGSALSAVPPVGTGLLVAAAALTAVSVGLGYLTSRNFHSNNFDQMEVNAQHVSRYTAKALVQELKSELQASQPAQPLSQNFVFNNHNAVRSDGKSWVQVAQASPQEINR